MMGIEMMEALAAASTSAVRTGAAAVGTAGGPTPWFDERTAGWVGGGLGTAIGVAAAVCGSFAWLLVRSEGGRTFLRVIVAAGTALGVVLLATGLTALTLGQPRHVWYALMLTGAILTFVIGIWNFLLPVIFRQLERQRLQARTELT